jgi:hypothetical protein
MKLPAQIRLEVANVLENFVEGRGGAWDWDTFLSERFEDEAIAAIQKRCARLNAEFPPEVHGRYCGEKGFVVVRGYVRQLREGNS